MAVIEWHSLLIAELSIAPGIADELSRQLVSHAREQGVALDDGRHAFVPADHGSEVQYHRFDDDLAIASIEGYLVCPDAMGHPAVFAWRSKTGADLMLTPERGVADLQFFWLTLPAPELAHPPISRLRGLACEQPV